MWTQVLTLLLTENEGTGNKEREKKPVINTLFTQVVLVWEGMSEFFFFCLFFCFVFGLEGSWGQPQGPNFPSPGATMLALRLDCSTAALTTPQKVLPSENWLSSRCLTSVVVRELVFPSWHQPLTSEVWYEWLFYHDRARRLTDQAFLNFRARKFTD